jgi:hypothetical protein
MKSIFTIHEGEYLVGSRMEQLFDSNGHKLNIWLPSKDSGQDFLVTDHKNRNSRSIQVKFSKDFLFSSSGKNSERMKNFFQCGGFWNIQKDKLQNSTADYWIFVLYSFFRAHITGAEKPSDFDRAKFIIVPKNILLEKLAKSYPNETKTYRFYLMVSKIVLTNGGKSTIKCFDARGKEKELLHSMSENNDFYNERDYSEYLNNWDQILNFGIKSPI